MRPLDQRSVIAYDGSLGVFAVVFLGYLAGAGLSTALYGAAAASAFFPPAGITVAAMLLTRRSRWPAIVLAIVLGEVLVDLLHGLSLSWAAGYALANVVEPLVSASLVRAWCGATPDLRRSRDLVIFVIGACLAGPLVGGTIGGAVSAVAAGSPWSTATLQWFAGDAISALVIGGPILLWPRQSQVLRDRPVESVTILVAAALLAWVGFGFEIPATILVLPVLAWAAVRLSVLGTALVGTVVAFMGNFMTVSGRGLFSDMPFPAPGRLAVAQVFVAVIVLVAMLIAQEVSQRTSAVAERDVERGERQRLESLAALGRRLSAALTPEEVSEALEQQMADGSGASFLRLSRDGSGPGLDGCRPAADAVRSGEPVVVGSAADYRSRYPDAPDWPGETGAESVVGWPLVSGGEPLGALVLAWPEPDVVDAEKRAYISTVASMAGQALARAQSYADEHDRAVVLHSALHPSRPVPVDGLEYAVAYEPSDTVHGLGGDWYDVLPLPGERVYVAIGDIVGHGLAAVEDMAQLRSAGRAFAHQGRSPAELLGDLNRFTDDVTRGEFATMAVVIVDHRAGSLTYATAGHPPPLLRRASDGRVVCLDAASGPALGPLKKAGYVEKTVAVHPGDVVMLYTDGLVEHPDKVVSAGIGRLSRVLADVPPAKLLDCSWIAGFLAPPPRADDVCLLAVRFG